MYRKVSKAVVAVIRLVSTVASSGEGTGEDNRFCDFSKCEVCKRGGGLFKFLTSKKVTDVWQTLK